MGKKKRRQKPTSTASDLVPPDANAVPHTGRRSRHLVVAGIVLGIVTLLWFLRLSPWLQLRHAEDALSRWQFETATQSLDDYPSWGPDPGRASFLRARLIRMQAGYAGAIDQLEASLALGYDPDSIDRERVLLDVQNLGPSPRLLGQLDRVLNQDPNDRAVVYEAFANGYFNAGKFDAAFDLLDRWEDEEPGDARPAYWKGVLSDLQGDADLAQSWFEKAIGRDAAFVDSYLALAKILTERSDRKALLRVYRRAYQMSPERMDVRIALGRLLWKQRAYDESVELLQPITKEAPEVFPAGHLVAQYHSLRGDHRRVIEVVEPMLEQFPDHVGLNYLVGSAYQAVGRTDQAQESMARFFVANEQLDLLRATPFDVPLDQQFREIMRRAELYRRYDWKRSLKWLDLATQSQPDNPKPHLLLSTYYQENGSLDQASRQRNIAETLASRLR